MQQAAPVDDPLNDFQSRSICLEGVTRIVRVSGAGPGVIVMAEMPGISPHVARFARWVRSAGFAVYLPSLFGRDGAVPQVEEGLAIMRRASGARCGAAGCVRPGWPVP